MKVRGVVAGVLVVCLVLLVARLLMPSGKSSEEICAEATEVVGRFYSGLRGGGEEFSEDILWAPALSRRVSALIKQNKKRYGGIVSWKVLKAEAGVLRSDGVPEVNQCTVVSRVEGSKGKSRVETIVLYESVAGFGVLGIEVVPVCE